MRPTKAQFDPVHHALGDIPSPFRDAALAAYRNTSSTLILNNGAQLSTPQVGADTSGPVLQLARFPVTMTNFDKRERPWAKRDWVKSMLREASLPNTKWQTLSPKNLWTWRKVFRQAVRLNEGIENNNHDSFREYNFDSCGASKSWGWKVKYADGESRLSAFSCKETACPTCYDKGKQRTASRYLNKIVAAASAQKVKRFWTFVITLPEEQEALPTKGSDYRKLLFDEIKKFERKLFGLKTEDGLFAYANVHAVGGSNLMRDRFHLHSGVLPLAVRRKKGESHILKCDPQGKIDVQAARNELAKRLKRVFPEIDKDLVQFRAEYFSLNSKKAIARLARRLKYDLRGFGKDVERAPIFFEPNLGLVVLDGGKDDYGIYSFWQIAERWKWIRKQRDLRSWGLLNQWNKYAEFIGVEFVEDQEPEIIDETPITVLRTFGLKWDKERAQAKWVDEKRAYTNSGKEIQGLEWGRKGSEGEWRPVVLPLLPSIDSQSTKGGEHA